MSFQEGQLFNIAQQICNGMKYLEENKIIHQ